jgi:hypothetical protein
MIPEANLANLGGKIIVVGCEIKHGETIVGVATGGFAVLPPRKNFVEIENFDTLLTVTDDAGVAATAIQGNKVYNIDITIPGATDVKITYGKHHEDDRPAFETKALPATGGVTMPTKTEYGITPYYIGARYETEDTIYFGVKVFKLEGKLCNTMFDKVDILEEIGPITGPLSTE